MPRGRSLRVAALLALVALTALGELHFVNVTFDDAFICFRYAENLVHGHGLVYNLGERVEGYSNFLWTVLLALPALLGADRHELGMLVAAKAMGALLGVACVLLTYATASWGRDERERSSALVAPAYLATSAPFCMWSVGALETPLVTLLTGLTLYLHIREDAALRANERARPWSLLVLAAAALTRPEPAAFFPLFALLRGYTLWQCRRLEPRALLDLAWFTVPFGAFLLFRRGYYDSWLPNTYYAKMYEDAALAARGGIYLYRINERLGLLPLAVAAMACLVAARRISRRVLTISALLAAQVAVVYSEGGDWMPGYRLLVPMLPLIGLLLHECWLALSALAAPLADARRAVARFSLLLLAAIGNVHAFVALPLNLFGSGLERWNLTHMSHFEIERWMRRELPRPGLLALGEAGIVPYYTKLPVLDLYGLTDAHIARVPGEMHRKLDLDYVFARKPEYFLFFGHRDARGDYQWAHYHASVLVHEPRFQHDYVELKRFDSAILYRRVARD